MLQIDQIARLWHVAERASFEALCGDRRARIPRDDNDRHARVHLPKKCQELQTINPRHVEVEQHEMWPVELEGANALRRRKRRVHVVPFREMLPQNGDEVGLIIHNQNSLASATCRLARSA